ncbi:4129_t:CDS:1 [Paraglomus brasilianum]|uniref:4129_t:CDS:1 n=1 Tax=Paraglomus brasilianum TaxID=144538 RepID=A0A9N9FH06_9GLOM|nr:4129_t:CDS:1 [Paraglomus brasilianum]
MPSLRSKTSRSRRIWHIGQIAARRQIPGCLQQSRIPRLRLQRSKISWLRLQQSRIHRLLVAYTVPRGNAATDHIQIMSTPRQWDKKLFSWLRLQQLRIPRLLVAYYYTIPRGNAAEPAKYKL